MLRSIENPKIEDMFSLKGIPFAPMDFADNDSKKYHIILVGLGGTGGYVIRDLSRFIYSVLRRDSDYSFKITCVDPDTVEEKNLLRQNFLGSDLGQNKAQVLAKRHAKAFGLEINVCEEFLTEPILQELTRNDYPNRASTIIIGCVDNNKARREISSFLENKKKKAPAETYYWIDSGNEKRTGQVILGSMRVPTVTEIFPEILDEKKDTVSQVSCAERMMQDEQNLFVNLSAANHVLNFLRSIILKENTFIHGVKFGIQGQLETFGLKEV